MGLFQVHLAPHPAAVSISRLRFPSKGIGLVCLSVQATVFCLGMNWVPFLTQTWLRCVADRGQDGEAKGVCTGRRRRAVWLTALLRPVVMLGRFQILLVLLPVPHPRKREDYTSTSRPERAGSLAGGLGFGRWNVGSRAKFSLPNGSSHPHAEVWQLPFPYPCVVSLLAVSRSRLLSQPGTWEEKRQEAGLQPTWEGPWRVLTY